MLGWLAKYITRERVQSDNKNRKKQFLSWKKVEKIVLLIDEKDVNRNEIDRILESTKKYIEVIYVQTSSKQASYGDWKCLVNKNKTFLGLPNAVTNALFRDKRYDIVINLCRQHALFAANLTSQLKAAFKCGFNNLFGELDLIIEGKQNQNLVSSLKDVEKYLQMIRTE